MKTRDLSFDFAKGLLITLVVIGHAIQVLHGGNYTSNPLYIFIYSFHMPAFIFISGYFAMKSMQMSFYDMLKTRIVRLLIPAIIWSIVRFGFVNRLEIDEKGLMQAMYNSCRGIWFLYCLFALYIIGNLVWKTKHRWLTATVIAIVGIASLPYWPIDTIKHFQIFRQWPLFAIGLLWNFKNYPPLY